MIHVPDAEQLDSDNDPVADTARIHAALAKVASPDDLAMVASVLEDMAEASEALHARRGDPKVTFFGSARIAEDQPAYAQAAELAGMLSRDGFTVITGGGPSIMTAALEAAGEGHAFGVGLELPWEQDHVSAFPLVKMERFLTRKLSMVRHVRAFVSCPGGVGTLDETTEVLQLLQTGKKKPAPVVLLQPEGYGQWELFDTLVSKMVADGTAKESDRRLYRICTDVREAYDEVVGFYSRYRDFGRDPQGDGRWAMWLTEEATADELEAWGALYPDLAPDGFEPREGCRIAFRHDVRGWGRLRELVDTVNGRGAADDRGTTGGRHGR